MIQYCTESQSLILTESPSWWESDRCHETTLQDYHEYDIHCIGEWIQYCTASWQYNTITRIITMDTVHHHNWVSILARQIKCIFKEMLAFYSSIMVPPGTCTSSRSFDDQKIVLTQNIFLVHFFGSFLWKMWAQNLTLPEKAAFQPVKEVLIHSFLLYIQYLLTFTRQEKDEGLQVQYILRVSTYAFTRFSLFYAYHKLCSCDTRLASVPSTRLGANEYSVCNAVHSGIMILLEQELNRKQDWNESTLQQNVQYYKLCMLLSCYDILKGDKLPLTTRCTKLHISSFCLLHTQDGFTVEKRHLCTLI